MGMKTRKEKALETRKSLYKSSIELFKEKGFDQVSIEDITNHAGTSKGSFYTYFKSKDDVILEHYKLIDKAYENVVIDKKDNFKEQIYQVLLAGFHFCDDIGYEFL